MSTPGVVLIIPVKRLAKAKSRLEVEPRVRRKIALSLAAHTIRTALETPQVTRVIVVTRDRKVIRLARHLGADVSRERPRSDLNRAARQGRQAGLRLVPGADVAIIVSDLPALTPADLTQVILRFRRTRHPLVVPDAEGTGTTMLLHPEAVVPPVLFGPASLRRHLSAGYELAGDAPHSARCDMDQMPTDDPDPARAAMLARASGWRP